MGIETLTSKEFEEARKGSLSIIAEIIMRETPVLEQVLKVFSKLQNEKAGLYRDLLKYAPGSEESELLERQLKEVNFELQTAEEYILELIQYRSN